MVEALIVVLFGMAWGSFLNVVIYRLPHGLNLAHPPSRCPKCETPIKAYHNIPVISYVLLGGKCRYCRVKIPFSYVLVEILTPLCFLLLYFQFSLSLHFFAACLFTSALIALGFIDYYHQILPDQITLPFLILALAYAFFREDLSLTQALVGTVSGAGFLLLVFGAYYLLRKKEGLGMGDVTLMLMIGSFLGWQRSFLTLILGSFLGALVWIYFLSIRKRDMQYALPFGSFLTPAAFIALVYGRQLIQWYLDLVKYPGG